MTRITFILTFCILSSNFLFSQKNVLLEKFTNVYCGSCPNATIKIEELKEKYPQLRVVKHFKPIDFDVNPMENDQSNQLWSETKAQFVPSGMVDRTFQNQALVHTSSRWEEMIISRMQEEDVVDISIKDIEYDSDLRHLSFSAEMNFKKDLPSNKQYRVHAMMIEDSVYYRQKSYFNDTPGHPLEGLGEVIWSYVHTDVVRAVIDDAWGVEISSDLVEGQEESLQFSYTIPEEHKAGRHSVTLVLSEYTDNTLEGRQVLDAEQFKLANLGVDFTSTEENDDNLVALIKGSNLVIDFLEVNDQYSSKLAQIYNMQGHRVWGQNSTKEPIDVSSLSQGQYILVVDGTGSKEAQTFFKR